MSYQSTGLPPTGFEEKRKLAKIITRDNLDPQSEWHIPEASDCGQIAIGWRVYDGDLGLAFQACAIVARTEPVDDKTRKLIGSPGPYLPPRHPCREFSKPRKGYVDTRTNNMIRDVMEITGFVEDVDQPVYFTLFGSQIQEIGGSLIHKLRRVQAVDAAGRKGATPIWLSRIRATTVHKVEDNGEWWQFNFEIEAKPGEISAPGREEIELGEQLAESVIADAKAKGWIIDEAPASAPPPPRPASLMTVRSGKRVQDEPPPWASQAPPPTSESDYGESPPDQEAAAAPARGRLLRRGRPEAVMTLGDPNLLGRALREDVTYPGQADWARPDVATTCSQCAYWQAAEQWMRKTRSKARCGMAARMMQRPTKQVPALAKSCRFYEPCG